MVHYWYPDELTDKSTLVCDGLVLDVTPLEHEEWKKTNGEIEPVRVYSAKIKVLSVLKGGNIDTVEMRYGLMDTQEIVFNGPCEINLNKGSKRRFYLNKDRTEKYYWGCLQGELDDDQSVGPILVPGSADDANLRLNEVMKGWNDLEHLLGAAYQLEGKPGFEEARDRIITKVLKLVMMCESLKKADTDQRQVKRTEDFYVEELGQWKESLFPEPHDGEIFDKLLSEDISDKILRDYVIKQMQVEPRH